MKCPHCLQAFHDEPKYVDLDSDSDGEWALVSRKCPTCNRFIFHLANGKRLFTPIQGLGLATFNLDGNAKFIQVRPKGASRAPCPVEVPQDLAEDYNESCLVLFDSPKASAALSRRCLQHLLREYAKVKHGDLYNEIEELVGRNIPSHIAEGLHAVRAIGNFAAHPMKSQSTGTICPVEPEEVEWNLTVLEDLFDFYFVAPEASRKRKAALNQKLTDAGKPPLK